MLKSNFSESKFYKLFLCPNDKITVMVRVVRDGVAFCYSFEDFTVNDFLTFDLNATLI